MAELEQRISERIQGEGPISFAAYMQMALYEPGCGYYVSGAHKMGWEEKDYATSTDLSTLFATCMGHQLQRMWEQLKRPHPFIALEQGAGRGHLAQGIRAWAEKESPDFYTALDYQLEDIRAGQDARDTVEHNTSQDKIAPSVILSNELIDAFPVHLVEKHGERLYESFVDMQQGRLVETLKEPVDAVCEDYLDRYQRSLAEP